VVPDEQQLGLEGEHAIERLDEAERVPVAVAPDRDEVREVAEQGAEEVAREADAVLRQPDHHGVGGLAARRRDQLEAEAAELEGAAILEAEGGQGPRLRRNLGAEVLPDVAQGLRDHRGEGEGAARGAEALDAGVVRLLGGIVRVRDDLRPLLPEQVDAAHVIDVALGQQDVADGPCVDGVEVSLVHRRLEAHAGVDDDAALGSDHQEGVGQPLGQADEVVDASRFGLGGGLDVEAAGAGPVEGGGHDGSWVGAFAMIHPSRR
jgi:hypothetical protein